MTQAHAPEPVSFTGKLGVFAAYPDHTLISFYVEGKDLYEWNNTSLPQRLYFRRSVDHGLNWGEPELAYQFPAEPGAVKMMDLDVAAIVDTEGTMHVYGFTVLNWDAEVPYRERIVKMWHLFSRDGRRAWQGPELIDYGHRYTGSLNALIQLSNGRMVMPFSYLSDRATGCFVSEVILSDDNGYTWRNAGADLVIDNGGGAIESGAVEPVAIELEDGRIWMVIRTQTGRLYESYSSDRGESWTVPEPTAFIASNAPAGLLKLRDNRIMMCWNHSKCEPIRHGISYSRQSLVAAVRESDGTWRGYREIVGLDREQDADHSLCYPWMSELGDGNVLVGYLSVHLRDWKGTVKFQMTRVNPEWVIQTSMREQWEQGVEASTVTSDGIEIRVGEDGGRALCLTKKHEGLPVGITRNFPIAKKGELTCRILLEEPFGGAYIALSEAFLKPEDRQGGLFRLKLEANGSVAVQYMNEGPYHSLRTNVKLERGKYVDVRIYWDCRHEHANLYLDNVCVGVLPQLEQGKGISYIRIHMAEAGGELRVESINTVSLDVYA